MKSLSEMIEDYLKTKKIRYIGRRPKKDNFKTNDIITVYHHDITEKVL